MSAAALLRDRWRWGADPKIASITTASVFAGLRPPELRHLSACLDEVEIPRSGYCLMREGRLNRTFWLLLDGEVVVTFAGHRLRSHGPGEVLGIPSLLDRRPAGVTVTSQGPLRALVASSQQFHAMRWLPAVELRLRAEISARLRDDYLEVSGLRPPALAG